MAKIHNQIGSLTELLSKLHEQNINDFHSLEEIRLFRNNYQDTLEKIKHKNKDILLQDIAKLEAEHQRLSTELDQKLQIRTELLQKEKQDLDSQISSLQENKGILTAVLNWYKKNRMLKRKLILETKFEEEKKSPFKDMISKIDTIQKDFNDKKEHPDQWVDKLSIEELSKISHIYATLEENKHLFYGAIGEERALSELNKLPDSYIVINDYRNQFHPPIYDRKNDDRIYSIQIDHIVIGPTGIYLIETKNWSQESVDNRDLFSPIKQLRRSSFAMFVLLNKTLENSLMHSLTGKWGELKISPKNILLLMNHKPAEEYQYVKILSLNEVINFINHGSLFFSEEVINNLTQFLLSG